MTVEQPKIAHLGLGEIRRALIGRRITATQLVAETLERIEAAQATLNAFRRIRRDAALIEARESDRRIAAGATAPLLGVPIAIKDDVDIAGEPTAFGCGGELPAKSEDSEVVRRLRGAGAIVVGKTNTPELGEWPFTHGDAFGHTRNPWQLEHTPGGSSGGSAAAVAAGLVPAALGSDTGGSIRIPAAWTNLVGIKPSRGRVPAPPVDAYGLTVIGPLARTVSDAALVLDVLADSGETFSAAATHDPGSRRIALSLAIPYTPFPATLSPPVRTAVQAVAEALRDLGHRVTAADPAYDPRLILCWGTRSGRGIAEAFDSLGPGARIDAHTRWNVRMGRPGALAARVARQRVEPILARRIGRIFDEVDLILAPTTATPPPAIDVIDSASTFTAYRAAIATSPYNFPWNTLGWPSIAVPAGFTADGLPLGAQLMGGPDSEALLISVAAQLESRLQWHRRRPG
ncbi:amidase [Nocardia huaxiensis]|uniref:amidase n=1 Tax=Nocardia huaxiensis TaxID=2755382 RepID=UPI001E510B0A|nr:amidase [Nocardia huaxiensis]UFS95892.1 amidase [Nocardia huaxiensis]